MFGDKKTVVFDPLEKGYWIDKNFSKKKINPSKYDIIYKPGFYKQMLCYKNLIQNKKLDWPGQDIQNVFKTIKVIEKLIF